MRLYNKNNMESLKVLEANSVDSVITDPPYGLSFMNKKWDYDVPSVEFWREVYRVLKPGGHILSFGGTRTYHRMVVNMEDAGFEIRDQIQWIYGSGVPKSLNIGKAVDKIEGNEREGGETKQRSIKGNTLTNTTYRIDVVKSKGTSQYEGWGSALKPANEPIVLARKPLSEKSISENVLRWRTGGLNIDQCRIGTDEKLQKLIHQEGCNRSLFDMTKRENGKKIEFVDAGQGRFPANVILECICDEVIQGERGEVKKSSGSRKDCDITHEWGYKDINRTNFTDKGDIHTNPDCPCYIMDEQSGVSKSTKMKTGDRESLSFFGPKRCKSERIENFGDGGGASRFFYRAKVSKKERNLGLDDFEDKKLCQGGYGGEWYSEKESDIGLNKIKIYKNNHPTVKAINLLTYLCRLITPPKGVVLDPYMGSGSTGVAALLEGFDFVGMELDKDYFEIAKKRIENYKLYESILKNK